VFPDIVSAHRIDVIPALSLIMSLRGNRPHGAAVDALSALAL